jgi:putative addiction module killer protein
MLLPRIATQIDIVVFETAAGQCPLKDWLRKLRNHEIEERIDSRLLSVRAGNLGKHAYSEGCWELKVDIAGGLRLYFMWITRNQMRNQILILCGGDKGSQTRDMARARQYWKEFKQINGI